MGSRRVEKRDVSVDRKTERGIEEGELDRGCEREIEVWNAQEMDGGPDRGMESGREEKRDGGQTGRMHRQQDGGR